MRSIPSTLSDALASGIYTPYFRAHLRDSNAAPLASYEIASFKIEPLEIQLKIPTETMLSSAEPNNYVQIERGIPGYTVKTSWFSIITTFWDGAYQTITAGIVPNASYNANAAERHYDEVIQEFCNTFGKQSAISNYLFDNWITYWFYASGYININSTDKFFTLLRQKYFIFAADAGNETIKFFPGWDKNEDNTVYLNAPSDFRLTEGIAKKRRYRWIDENGTYHETAATTSKVGTINSTGYALCLFIDPSNGTMYAATDDTTRKIYRSTDSGATWTPVMTVSGNIYAIYKDSVNGYLYAMGGGYIYSSQDGTHWTQSTGGYSAASNLAEDDNYYYLGTSNAGAAKLIRCAKGTASWSVVSTITEDVIWSIAITETEIIIGTQTGTAGKIMRRPISGGTFTTEATTDAHHAGSLITTSPHAAISGAGIQIRSSIDEGDTWVDGKWFFFEGYAKIYSLTRSKTGAIIACADNKIAISQGNPMYFDQTGQITPAQIRAAVLSADGTTAYVVGGTPAELWKINFVDTNAPVHNLGYLSSTDSPPPFNFQETRSNFGKFQINLEVESGDYVIVTLLDGSQHQINCAQVTEVMEQGTNTYQWHLLVEQVAWLENTAGGQLPSTIERVSNYTPLNTSTFDKVLSASDNNLQAAMETLDEHTHSATAANYKPLTGFPNRTDSSLSFVDGTRVFTVAPAVTSFDIYSNATKFTKSTAQTVTIPNTVGQHFIYFDTSGNLQSSTTTWNITSNNIPVATVYWNGSNGIIGDERHNAYRDPHFHKWAHDTIGARYESGLSGSFGNSTFSVALGKIHDEDIELSITAQTTCRLFYRAAGGASMTFESGITAPYKATAGALKYDNAGTLTSVSTSKYVCSWVYATNDTAYPIYITVGQAEHNTLADARAAAEPTYPAFGTREFKLIYKVIYQNSGGTPTYIEAIDYRLTSSLPGGSVSTIQAAAVSFTPAGNIAATNVQAALEELDSEKAPAAQGVTNGNSHDHNGGDGAQIAHGGLAGIADDDHTRYNNYSTTAYHSTTQSINNNADTVLSLNSETHDDLNWHDLVTNNSRITVNQNGIYMMMIHNLGWVSNATGYRKISILRNGMSIDTVTQVPVNGADHYMNINTIRSLSANDYIEISVLQTSGGALNVQPFTKLTVCLIRPT